MTAAEELIVRDPIADWVDEEPREDPLAVLWAIPRSARRRGRGMTPAATGPVATFVS